MGIVRAADFDLSQYPAESIFVLDTNILYFVHSGYYLPTEPKSVCYSNLIQQILNSGRTIIVSALNLQELLYGIEGKEYQAYLNANNLSRHASTKKDFRNDPLQRQKLKAKLQTVITEITAVYTLIGGQVFSEQICQFADQLEKHHYDPIDYIMVNDLLARGKPVFISDDTDFQFDSRIDLITA